MHIGLLASIGSTRDAFFPEIAEDLPSRGHEVFLAAGTPTKTVMSTTLKGITHNPSLHTPYFGRQGSPDMLAALRTLRRRGVVVIVEETHRLFSGPSPVADIRVASLRKLFPVYGGGYVTNLTRNSHPVLHIRRHTQRSQICTRGLALPSPRLSPRVGATMLISHSSHRRNAR
jgi:hypothetical protein